MAVTLPLGFRAAGIAAGLKRSGKHDLGVLLVDQPAVWAFTGTLNDLRAACVDRNRALYDKGDRIRAIVVNSGNANCATGEEGIRNNERYAQAVAGALELEGAHEVLTASTGVVGQQLDMARLEAGVRRLPGELAGSVDAFSRAILTTDTVTKQATVELPGGGRIVGVAKGSGMIHPNMATMLAFITTDVTVPKEQLRETWRAVVGRTFNQVTVDGDTSPNDMAMLVSSGQVDTRPDEFEAGLETVARSLARQIARDGEGARKLLTVEVTGAAQAAHARAVARTIAGSPLVKAAVHGADPNWGRIIVAAGRAGAGFDPLAVTIRLQDVPVYSGAPVSFDAATLSATLREAQEVTIGFDLGQGDARGEAWGCDLTDEYVRINADYTT